MYIKYLYKACDEYNFLVFVSLSFSLTLSTYKFSNAAVCRGGRNKVAYHPGLRLFSSEGRTRFLFTISFTVEIIRKENIRSVEHVDCTPKSFWISELPPPISTPLFVFPDMTDCYHSHEVLGAASFSHVSAST